LKTGEVQASSYWGHDPARDGYTLMSDTLLNGTWRLFHLRGTVLPRWNRLADLSRYRFGTTRSYTYPDELDRLIRNGTLKVVVASDDESTMVNLLQGTVDIVPIDELTGEAVLMSPVFTQQALNSIVFDDKPFSASPGYLLVRKTREGTRLVHLFNMGLASMKADGTLKRYEREMFKSMTDEAQVNLRP
jgi:polar amino acid transport system substrate-binding protein